ncbi:MAG: chemotaxis response regulator protein-glutamate methylesterase [Gemmatimonadota bacterium]
MIRVLLVDDSVTVRRALQRELAKYPDFEVVGAAADPYEARELIAMHRPDVITLDLQMPRMGGLEFLEKIMRHHPLPVIVLSSVAAENSEPALRALELGALEVIQKPDSANSLFSVGKRLATALREGARARVRGVQPLSGSRLRLPQTFTTKRLIGIGASTGGIQAIERLVRVLPATLPGVVIAQHLPAEFTDSFARRLNQYSEIEIREARNGDLVTTGTALVAPGGLHTRICDDDGVLRVLLEDTPAVNYQKPSVDVLFDSIAEAAGADSIGILLTGMGGDGASGLRNIRDAGGYTVVQSMETCVVFGMPKEAIARGAAQVIAPLDSIAELIVSAVSRA